MILDVWKICPVLYCSSKLQKICKTSRKLLYFENYQVCACLIYAFATKFAFSSHLIKIRTFLRKEILIKKEFKFAGRFENFLRISCKFLAILNSTIKQLENFLSTN